MRVIWNRKYDLVMQPSKIVGQVLCRILVSIVVINDSFNDSLSLVIAEINAVQNKM